MDERQTLKPLILAGVMLGIGLGGFFDGIVLHQILQWHHMGTSAGYPASTLDFLELNVVWDGLFHAFTFLFTAGGVFMLFRALRRDDVPKSLRTLIGSELAGWGGFNLVEGLVNHHLLQIHHVRPGPDQLAWDLGFLAWGAVMLVGGWLLIRAERRELGLEERPLQRRANA